MRKEHRRLLEWWYFEREKQENRFQQSIDADYYDNPQWDPDDAEIGPFARPDAPRVQRGGADVRLADWHGAAHQGRLKVLPRTEDDVQIADVKTKVLKYVADINRAAFCPVKGFR